jgi:hypothetical protein
MTLTGTPTRDRLRSHADIAGKAGIRALKPSAQR